MKLTKIFFIISFSASLMLMLSSCGGLKVDEGDLGFLQGVKALNIQYDYSDMGVGKYESEQDYVNEKVADYNKKQEGKGDTWAKAWKSDRKNRYQPAFEDKLRDQLSGSDVKISDGTNAKYTMKVHTKFMEPGWNIGIMRRYAHINVEITFFEAANPSNVLAKIIMRKVPGRTYGGGDYDVAVRLEEAYAKLGKDIGKGIKGYF